MKKESLNSNQRGKFIEEDYISVDFTKEEEEYYCGVITDVK